MFVFSECREGSATVVDRHAEIRASSFIPQPQNTRSQRTYTRRKLHFTRIIKRQRCAIGTQMRQTVLLQILASFKKITDISKFSQLLLCDHILPRLHFRFLRYALR